MLLQRILPALALAVGASEGYHVVVFHNWGTKSHLIHFAPMVEGLLDRGHHVTAVVFSTLNVGRG